jgi:hypothetical protein
MQENSNTQGGGTVETFLKMEAEGFCDGFLWPYEGGRVRDLKWADGKSAVPYETVKGTLWMREGAYKHYGFSEAHLFAKAAKTGKLIASKTKGIVTLGPLRGRVKDSKLAYVIVEDCPVKLQFIINSPEEEAGVFETLSKFFHGNKIFLSGAFLGGIHFPTPNFWKTFNTAMNGPHRRSLFFLMGVGLISVLLTFAGVFSRGGYLGGSLVGFLFVLLVLRFCSEIRSGQAQAFSDE